VAEPVSFALAAELTTLFGCVCPHTEQEFTNGDPIVRIARENG
jgi:hypothetical protein